MKLNTITNSIFSLFLSYFILSSSVEAATKALTLFNGRNMEGWKHVGPGYFTVEDHLLVSHGGMGLLYYTRQKFGNAKLRVVYKTSYATTDAGIVVRIANVPNDAWYAVHHGYEIQIADKGRDEYHRTGAIYSFAKSTSVPSHGPGKWNTCEIIMRGQIIEVILNGKKVTTFDPKQPVPPRKQDSDPMRGFRPVYGYIGLQNHDHTASQADSHIYIKEVSIQPFL